MFRQFLVCGIEFLEGLHVLEEIVGFPRVFGVGIPLPVDEVEVSIAVSNGVQHSFDHVLQFVADEDRGCRFLPLSRDSRLGWA